jgi:hypothetical protein
MSKGVVWEVLVTFASGTGRWDILVIFEAKLGRHSKGSARVCSGPCIKDTFGCSCCGKQRVMTAWNS